MHTWYTVSHEYYILGKNLDGNERTVGVSSIRIHVDGWNIKYTEV